MTVFINLQKSPIDYVWKLAVPAKIKILIWVAFLDRLHTEEML